MLFRSPGVVVVPFGEDAPSPTTISVWDEIENSTYDLSLGGCTIERVCSLAVTSAHR